MVLPLPELSHAGAYTHAGPEIGVASTKAFTAQLAVLTMVALKIAKQKGSIDEERYMHLLQELHDIPDKIAEVLKQQRQLKSLQKNIKMQEIFFISVAVIIFLWRLKVH